MKYIKLHITVELPLHKVTLRGILACCSITLSYNKSPKRQLRAFCLSFSQKSQANINLIINCSWLVDNRLQTTKN